MKRWGTLKAPDLLRERSQVAENVKVRDEVIMVIRTALRDRTLRADLSGYAGYARQVRYRLLPGVWQSTKRRCSDAESADVF